MTLKAKNEAADKLIKIVSAENEIVQKEKLIGIMVLMKRYCYFHPLTLH